MHAWPESADPAAHSHSRISTDTSDQGPSGSIALPNGPGSSRFTHVNGHARTPSEAQRIQDAETFELQGLISDEEEDEDKVPPYEGRRHGPGPRKPEDEESAPLFRKDRE